MRFFIAVLGVVALQMAWLSPNAAEAANNKHAALVMDADTGAVMFEENGTAKRYPASLTTMMTLYMLFDAMRADKVSLSTKMTASKKAASQPQTNVSLRPGDKISVKDAIKALIVRSANDVAVVVAEHLGRTEWNFGVMMTSKARELGLKNTVFRNPQGLPDNRQYTTAQDMAILGAALRRDFPQYYNSFRIQEFTFKGRLYKGHNRVLGRFAGVDGIKTGYIRASGFNLVSSVKRDGFNIVAVVMGGNSGASRDDYMVSLLDRTFVQLDKIKDRPRYIATAPLPEMNPRRAEAERLAALGLVQGQQMADAQQAEKPRLQVMMEEKAADQARQAQAPSFSLSFDDGEDDQPAQKAAPPLFRADFVPPKAPTPAPLPPKGTLDYQYAMLQQGSANPAESAPLAPSAGGKDWGVQVGAFRQEYQARAAVKKVFNLVQQDVKDAYITISSQGRPKPTIHRARLGNLSREQAGAVCQKLISMNESCFPVRIN